MKLTHLKSFTSPRTISKDSSSISRNQSKVTSLCYSPDGDRLAVATADRTISLYNDQGEVVDKFNTKPNGDGPKDYLITAIQFGPEIEQPKLAVAQSDAIIFVYKWKVLDSKPIVQRGLSTNSSKWDAKKSICNKFHEESTISSLVWSRKDPFLLVYGTMEGKVRIGNVLDNKAKTLFKFDVAVVSLAFNLETTEILSGHADGTIYRFTFPTNSKSASCIKLVNTSTVPYALSWGKSICVCGINSNIMFYNEDGQELQCFTQNDLSDCIDTFTNEEASARCYLTTASCSPTGDVVIVGSFNCFYVFCWDSKQRSWEEKAITIVKNMYNVTAISWKPNGSALVVGTSSGLIDRYDAAYQQYTYKDTYVITYVTPSQILVHDKYGINSSPALIQSAKGEILKIKIYHDPVTTTLRYLVARTKHSIIFCDLECPNAVTSEVKWPNDQKSNEKFIFDAANACIISNSGELSIVEYGQDKILRSVRTEYTSPYLLSLRVNECLLQQKSMPQQTCVKHIAYLLDQQTICVTDLENDIQHSVSHKVSIDFLELNESATLIIFRDKEQDLYLFDVLKQMKSFLQDRVGYAQWIPESDGLVAQSRNQMFVWYNLNNMKQVSTVTINGDIETIQRVNNKTDVLVNEKGSLITYTLSEELINFTTALHQKMLGKCLSILESMEESSRSTIMWQDLRKISLDNNNIFIAARCASALGIESEARYLTMSFNGIAKSIRETSCDNWESRAIVLKLKRDFVGAEKLYISHSKVNDAIEMYEDMMMFADALRLAHYSTDENVKAKREIYLQLLQQKNQLSKAALLKAMDGDCISAISMYLEAGSPGKAAEIIIDQDIAHPQKLLESVAITLSNLGFFQESGRIYECMGQNQAALSHYLEGKAFRDASILAKDKIPSKTVMIGELWGDYLVSCGRYVQAIDLFLDSHMIEKAIKAAVNAGLLDRASEIVSSIVNGPSISITRELACAFMSAKRFEEAKDLFLQADMCHEAITMYLVNNKQDEAISLAEELLSIDEQHNVFLLEADKMVESKSFSTAEYLYIKSNNTDKAIEMWKKTGSYEDAIRVAITHRPELTQEIYIFAANSLENIGRLTEAEKYFISACEWLSAINMYRKRDMWNEAIRIAKACETDNLLNRVAYAYAVYLGERATETLTDLKIMENAIQFAVDMGEFENALELASSTKSSNLLSMIHSRFAKSLQERGEYDRAESEYIQAGDILGAVEMYILLTEWDDAERIALKFDHSLLPHVYTTQADNAAQHDDFQTAEHLFIKGRNAEGALQMYKSKGMLQDVFRVTKDHFPHLLAESNMAALGSQIKSTQINKSKLHHLHHSQSLESSGRFNEAIEYLLALAGTELNPNDLEELWDNAIRVSEKKIPKRLNEVSQEVAKRLCKLGKEFKAAEILCQSNQLDFAVNILLASEHWEQAKAYAEGNPTLTKICNDAHKEYLISKHNSDELLSLGEFEAALYVMKAQGDWDRIWKLWRSNDFSDVNSFVEFSLMRMKELLTSKSSLNMCTILEMILDQMAPPPNYNDHFDLYLVLVQQILGLDKEMEESMDYCNVIQRLRNVLLLTFHKHLSYHDQRIRDYSNSFFTLLLTVHYYFTMLVFRSQGLSVIACKVSITLLRYAVIKIEDGTTYTIIPSDKAFYQAGTLCSIADNDQLAFIFLNRYIDIAEVIEENNDLSDFTEGDFLSTDIPFDRNIPNKHYIKEKTREEVRDWVLSTCIDSNVDRTIPMRENVIRGELHDGIYNVGDDKCIITGYPIPPNKLDKIGKYKVNIDDWDSMVNQINKSDVLPWDEYVDIADFLSKN